MNFINREEYENEKKIRKTLYETSRCCMCKCGFSWAHRLFGGASSSASSTAADTDVTETAVETESSSTSSTVADTVVYGKIYTANSNQDYVEAFAVKDGKYIYVGSKDGASKYVKEGTTQVLDYSDGFVMPSN